MSAPAVRKYQQNCRLPRSYIPQRNITSNYHDPQNYIDALETRNRRKYDSGQILKLEKGFFSAVEFETDTNCKPCML